MQLEEVELWILFSIIVGVSLLVDLGFLNKINYYLKKKFRKKQSLHVFEELSFKQSLTRTILWFGFAGIFTLIIFFTLGHTKMLEFLTGYVLEESLSVDNMMLFLLVFSTLGIPHKYQHKVLTVGILFAIVMRIIVILIGSSLLENFQWMIYVFGAILLVGALRMISQRKETKMDLKKNLSVKLLKKIIPIKTEITDHRFFSRTDNILHATPLFVSLIVISFTDIIFAMDSIPAVLAVTTDPFIVITSNIFAISGLRALYFLVSNAFERFYYLKIGLIILLFFIGIKMLISEFYVIPTLTSFAIVVLILGVVMIASLFKNSGFNKKT